MGETLRAMLDHLRLTVRDVEEARRLYDPVMRCLGLEPVGREDGGAAWGSQETGWLILTSARRVAAHDAGAPGLHHVAFKAASRAVVDRVHELVVAAGAEVLDPPAPYDDEPDHYAVFFRDPNGFKLEVVHVDTP
jgi:catechol 2,3-dioxygenase-like lactoylglutathione lyase family enzyme